MRHTHAHRHTNKYTQTCNFTDGPVHINPHEHTYTHTASTHQAPLYRAKTLPQKPDPPLPIMRTSTNTHSPQTTIALNGLHRVRLCAVAKMQPDGQPWISAPCREDGVGSRILKCHYHNSWLSYYWCDKKERPAPLGT